VELSHLGVVLEVGDRRVFILDGLHLDVRLSNLLGRLGRLGEGLGREVGLVVWVVQDLGKLLLLFLVPNRCLVQLHLGLCYLEGRWLRGLDLRLVVEELRGIKLVGHHLEARLLEHGLVVDVGLLRFD
jgi:hypothetical protein